MDHVRLKDVKALVMNQPFESSQGAGLGRIVESAAHRMPPSVGRMAVVTIQRVLFQGI